MGLLGSSGLSAPLYHTKSKCSFPFKPLSWTRPSGVVVSIHVSLFRSLERLMIWAALALAQSTRSRLIPRQAFMADGDKMLNQIMELRFTSKSLHKQARKCEKEEKSEKLKVKKAMEKSKMDDARLCAENSIRKRTEQLNCLRLSSRLDAVISQLDTQAKMMTINRSLASLVKTLDAALDTNNLLKMSKTLDEFEKQFANMEVQAQFVENAMAGSTSLSIPDDKANELMQQVADEYGLQISVGLPQAEAQLLQEPSKVPEEDELSRRLADLKDKG